MPRGARALGLIALLAGFAAQAGEVAPLQLLLRMSESLRQTDFEGSFIYQHGGRTDALRIFHLGGSGERERLISLNGARGEIVRDGNTITCVQAGGASTVFANGEDPHLLPLVPNVREIGEQYDVTDVGVDRVAGYDARVVDISPRDGFRYGYRLWLQEDGDMLLRSAVLDAAHHPLEQFMFVALEVGARPDAADLMPAGEVRGAATPPSEVPVETRPLWRVVQAPAGFRLVRTQKPVDGPPRAEHLVYTDGVASVSVYVEPHSDSEHAPSESTIVRGVLSVHSRDASGVLVTALGDVPPATVQAMARGVRAAD
jgi:sigma-E factor negative regulatory protein RseB